MFLSLPLWRLAVLVWPLCLLATATLVSKFIFTFIINVIRESTSNVQLLKWTFLGAFICSLIAYFAYKNYLYVRKVNNLPGLAPTVGIAGYTLLLIEAIISIGSPTVGTLQIAEGGRKMITAIHGRVSQAKIFPITAIWIGPKAVVSIFTPEAAEVILSSNEIIRKSDTYNLLHPWLGTGLLTSWGRKWHSNRKLLTPAFHFTILESFVPVMARNAKILVANLEKMSKADENGVVNDLSRPILLCALDVICETAMGRRIYAQEDPEAKYVKSVHEMGESVMTRFFQPWTWNETLFSFTSYGKRIRSALNILHEFTDRVIKERTDEIKFGSDEEDTGLLQESKGDDQSTISLLEKMKKKREPFMDTLIQEHLKRPSEFSTLNIREEVDTFMFEGHDTTAWGTTWSIYLLGLHPEIQEKVHEEVDILFDESPDGDLSLEDLKTKLPFTEAVIKEAQRLYPSVPIIMRSLEQDVKICGYEVPAGVELALHVNMIHRDPDHWPEPERFIPERFLSKERRHPYAYIPFSAGPRNCIGQKFAMLEEKALLAYVLRSFKVTSIDHRDKVIASATLISKAIHPIRVKLEVRNNQ